VEGGGFSIMVRMALFGRGAAFCCTGHVLYFSFNVIYRGYGQCLLFQCPIEPVC
jgi:hypothetical protein